MSYAGLFYWPVIFNTVFPVDFVLKSWRNTSGFQVQVDQLLKKEVLASCERFLCYVLRASCSHLLWRTGHWEHETNGIRIVWCCIVVTLRVYQHELHDEIHRIDGHVESPGSPFTAHVLFCCAWSKPIFVLRGYELGFVHNVSRSIALWITLLSNHKLGSSEQFSHSHLEPESHRHSLRLAYRAPLFHRNLQGLPWSVSMLYYL